MREPRPARGPFTRLPLPGPGQVHGVSPARSRLPSENSWMSLEAPLFLELGAQVAGSPGTCAVHSVRPCLTWHVGERRRTSHPVERGLQPRCLLLTHVARGLVLAGDRVSQPAGTGRFWFRVCLEDTQHRPRPLLTPCWWQPLPQPGQPNTPPAVAQGALGAGISLAKNRSSIYRAGVGSETGPVHKKQGKRG